MEMKEFFILYTFPISMKLIGIGRSPVKMSFFFFFFFQPSFTYIS
jgi:hypothetical protein